MNNLELVKIYKRIKKTILDEDNALPSNAFFMDEDVVLTKDDFNQSRHPYSVDGLTLWAYSSGYITLNESNFYIFPQTLEGKETYLNFYAGFKNKNGKYDYFSLLGVNDTIFGLDKELYVLFNPTYALYIRKVNNVIFGVKLSISKNQDLILSINAYNLGKKDQDIYLSSYINPVIIHSNYESEETKWFKKSTLTNFGALIESIEDISRDIHLYNYCSIFVSTKLENKATTSKTGYIGNKNGSLNASKNLLNGKINSNNVTSFIDNSIYGDISYKKLIHRHSAIVNYRLSFIRNKEDLNTLINIPYLSDSNDYDFAYLMNEYEKNYKFSKNRLKIQFEKTPNLNEKKLNKFIDKVIFQVDYCSKAKNSSLMLLGIRDVSQMLEAMVMWNAKLVKEKIKVIFNYVSLSGRAPRQISIAKNDEKELLSDNREFIDQGEWLISLIYKYLAYTNDYDILKIETHYISFLSSNKIEMLNNKGTILDHLYKIMNYLISNMDEDNHLLHTLYGDWNDAVDGLGKGDNNDYGNGVSIMASMHLYKNLDEFIKILMHLKKDTSLYVSKRKELLKGIEEYGIIKRNNKYRIIHGYGNNKSFYVGSFSDIDNKSRHSSTVNSFYAISKINLELPYLKDDVLEAFHVLDSKYGIRTFDIPFSKEDAFKVGRIVNLPFGTAENAATYIHASMFALNALALLDEGDFSYEQLIKLLPISHKKISTSPFVMPNSYLYNEELNIDGESMNDWYTGSSNTLLKAIVDSYIGFVPTLDNKIIIRPINTPIGHIYLEISAKNRRFKINYYSNKNENLLLVNSLKMADYLIDLDKIKDKIINITIYTKKK